MRLLITVICRGDIVMMSLDIMYILELSNVFVTYGQLGFHMLNLVVAAMIFYEF